MDMFHTQLGAGGPLDFPRLLKKKRRVAGLDYFVRRADKLTGYSCHTKESIVNQQHFLTRLLHLLCLPCDHHGQNQVIKTGRSNCKVDRILDMWVEDK